MVRAFGMRHVQLCVLLGDGWRESGLRGHGSGTSRGHAMRFAGLVAAATATFASLGNAQKTVTAENPLNVERHDEMIAVPWSSVSGLMNRASLKRLKATDASGREMLSQVIDNDGDGKN